MSALSFTCVTPSNVFDHFMVICNSLNISYLHLNDIIRVKTGILAFIMRCIQVTGGGVFRYALNYDLKFISDFRPQENLEALQPGAMIIPVIVSSDKTQLTHFRDKQAYPVYITIGNIPKDIRRKPSWHAQLLVAYLPTTKLGGISNMCARRRALANLFHACMCDILDPIASHAETGLPMMSGDGVWWRCHPILAVFIGDYPEQTLVTCTYNG